MPRTQNILTTLIENSNLTRANICKSLGITPSTLSEREKKPDNIPNNKLLPMLKLLGVTDYDLPKILMEIVIYSSDDKEEVLTIISDSQLSPVIQERAYLNTVVSIAGNIPDKESKSRELKAAITYSRKPLVVVVGETDAGKSTHICKLLGLLDFLPAKYQPSTSAPTVVKHIEERPKDRSDNYFILSKTNSEGEALDIRFISSPTYIENFILDSGDRTVLDMWGTSHEGSKDANDRDKVGIVIAYADSPILKICDLSDSPGFGHNESDTGRSYAMLNNADACIYASSVTAFLRKEEPMYLSACLKQLEQYSESKSDTLKRLFVIQTRADLNKNANETIHRASKDAFNTLELKNEYDLEEFQSRFFSVSNEDDELSAEYYHALSRDLIELSINQSSQNSNKYEEYAKTQFKEYESILESLENLSDTKSKAELLKKIYTENKSEFEKEIIYLRNDFREYVDKLKTESGNPDDVINNIVDSIASEENIAKLVDEYNNKKDAEEKVPQRLQMRILKEIEINIKTISSDLNEKIESSLQTYLENINEKINKGLKNEKDDPIKLTESLKISMVDINSAFLSGIAASGVAGAFAAWVAVAAAGSNLGSYIVIAKISSFLTGLGIAHGGSAALISFIAACGGPTVVIPTLAITIGLIWYAIIGSNWKKRMTSEAVKKFNNNKVRRQYQDIMRKFWNDTDIAVEASVNGVSEMIDNKITELDQYLTLNNIEDRIKYQKEILGFFKEVLNIRR